MSKLINIAAGSTLIAARVGSKQATMIDMLARKEGATLDAIAKATSWPTSTVKSGFYYDLKRKGYGVSTKEAKDGTQTHFLVLPKGVSKPLPHVSAKTTKATKTVETPTVDPKQAARDRKNARRRAARAAKRDAAKAAPVAQTTPAPSMEANA